MKIKNDEDSKMNIPLILFGQNSLKEVTSSRMVTIY